MSVSTIRSSPSLISPMATPATGLDTGTPAGHQGHGGGAHRAHRGGPVRLERLRDHPHHVGEVLLARDRGRQSALGERAMADVAALRAAHEARLPDRERREVVVVPEGLRLLQAQVVDSHVHAARPERDVGEDLGLPASEQARSRARGARCRPRTRSAGSRPAARPSGRFLSTAMRRRMISFSSRSNARETSARRSGSGSSLVRGGCVLLEDLLLDRLRGLLSSELLVDLRRLVELRAVRGADLLDEVGVDLGRLDLELLLARLVLRSS